MLKRSFTMHFLMRMIKTWLGPGQTRNEQICPPDLLCCLLQRYVPYTASFWPMVMISQLSDCWQWLCDIFVIPCVTSNWRLHGYYKSLFGVRFSPHDAAGGGQLHLKYDIYDNSILYRKYERAIFMERPDRSLLIGRQTSKCSLWDVVFH